MKKFVILLLAALLIAGCAPAEKAGETKKYLIGVSQCNLGEPWRVAMNNQIAAAAEKYPMFDLIFEDAAQSNEKQAEDIQKFVDMGVDLIITSPNEAEPLTPAIESAYNAGIPVILLDRKINSDKYTQFIGADNEQIGRQVGEYIADTLLPDGGTVLEIKGLSGASAGIERDAGFKEGVSKNPRVIVAGEAEADWLKEKAVTAATELLSQNPDADAIFALNDPMAEGAYQAAKSAGLEKSIKFIGIDGLTTPDGGIRSVLDGRLALTVVYPTGGEQAIDSAYKLLAEGKPLEKTLTLDAELVTPQNAAEIWEKYS